ncbi:MULTISPECIES: helix-turn-helix domain-containing protein [unclassified Streptomyces]|uniref:ArsR/SmtB family transcription factor n=1 Tax=unclassified Streptomyces TaxID=2593676 RepID=UPI0033C139F4
MIEFRFGVGDLASTSFAYSPFQEAVFSLWGWADVSRFPHQRPWLRRLRPVFERQDTELFAALIAPHGFIPDFLTPRPERVRPSFAEQSAQLRRTPLELIGPDFRRTFGPGAELPPVIRRGLADPAALLERIASAFDRYWEQCLAPDWWPRARAVLEADLAHQSRVLAEQGAAGLFRDLDKRLSWRAGVLRLRHPVPDTWPAADIQVAGRGMVLMPTTFVRGAITTVDTTLPPVLNYPAHGRGTLGEAPPPVSDRALVRLLGPARARLLTLLAEPATTTELARRLEVTPGAVSQHLSVLYDAGLLHRARRGRGVEYARTALGDELLRG